ncbi:MAG: nicotinate (nicotinamide) nucleotide adenylyltransferase [Butyrivibrio sp.]|nr:nicotinate (nicotinamide) nucleotide adenylyltransferase [Butyrivibrio sp.]
MEVNKKIGLFGGTFDPFHNGHLSMMKNAYEEAELDKIIVIPTGHPYQKEDLGLKISLPRYRVGMIKNGIEDLDFPCEISEIELEKDRPSYTVETVAYFKDIYPKDELFWICGSDVLFGIDKWVNPEKLLKSITLLVVVRGTDTRTDAIDRKKYLEDKYGARIIITKFKGPDISSTMIKKDITENADLMPKRVYRYIVKNNIYE